MSGKKKQRKPRGLTRVELTEKLGVGLTTVDRLIAFGLESSGRRGRAKIYSLSAARRMARRLAPAELAAADVLIVDYRTHAEDFHDRRQALIEEWIADTDWLPAWRQFIAMIGSVTATWPGRIGARLGSAVPCEASLFGWADGPRTLPPLPARVAGEEAIAAVAQSIQMARSVQPFMRPRLDELARAIESHPSTAVLAPAIEPPAREPLPNAPTNVDEARSQWREARSAYRRVRVAVRRDHRRRDELGQNITSEISEFRAVWWASRGQLVGLAGDEPRARLAAERICNQTLTRLSTLNGTVPADEKKTMKRAASARKSRKK